MSNAPLGAGGWPPDMSPAESSAYDRNEVLIGASVEIVWAAFIRIGEWPSWFPEVRPLSILAGDARDLGPRSVFSWTVGGMDLTSEVVAFVPRSRIAWRSRGAGIVCHREILFARAPGGTLVTIEAVQKGWLPKLRRAIMPNATAQFFRQFLNDLDGIARGEPRFVVPPPVLARTLASATHRTVADPA